jgi:hypothetical protein
MEWTDKENHVAVIALHKCGIERESHRIKETSFEVKKIY